MLFRDSIWSKLQAFLWRYIVLDGASPCMYSTLHKEIWSLQNPMDWITHDRVPCRDMASFSRKSNNNFEQFENERNGTIVAYSYATPALLFLGSYRSVQHRGHD